jgi:hypothetical protein
MIYVTHQEAEMIPCIQHVLRLGREKGKPGVIGIFLNISLLEKSDRLMKRFTKEYQPLPSGRTVMTFGASVETNLP